MGCTNKITTNKQKNEQYRTTKDITKEIAKTYQQLGKLLWELDRMIHKNKLKLGKDDGK